MPVKRLELRSDQSNKFWQIDQQGSQTTVSYGAIGKDGQTRTKVHASPEVAAAEAAKLIRSKTAKGYAAVDAFQIGAAPSVPLPGDKAAPKGAVSLYDVRTADAGGALVPARRLKETAGTLSFISGLLRGFEKDILKAPVTEPAEKPRAGESHRDHMKRKIRAMASTFNSISVETRDAVPELVKRFEALFEGPRAALLRTPFTADLPREAIEGLQADVNAIGTALGAFKLPPGMHNPSSTLLRFRGPKLDVPKLTVAAFAALSVSDRLNAMASPARWDCEMNDVEGDIAAAERIVGKPAVAQIIEQLWEHAEESNADNEELSGDPWISIEVLERNGKPLAYQVSGHLEVEPYGGDFTYDLFANSKGEIFDESIR